MNSDDINFILNKINILEENAKCNFCEKNYKNPVRLKSCGHYFCEVCLQKCNKKEYLCPKCKAFYEQDEITSSNIVMDTKNNLTKIKQIFDSIKNNTHIFVNSELTDVDCEKSKLKEIFYNNKRYQLVFVGETHQKLNSKGESSLHIACRKKRLVDVMSLLNSNMDINLQDYAGWAPLHEAVESRNCEIVEELLKHGALIDILGEDYTSPLHKAATLGDEKLIRLLLLYGANKDLRDYFGKMPTDYVRDINIRKVFEETFQKTERVEKIFCSKKVAAYCYYVDKEYVEKLQSAKVKVEECYLSKKVSHFIIRKTHKPSIKILVAMLQGCTIASQEWINNFLQDEHFIPIPIYTYLYNKELNAAIQKAMMNSLLKLPTLFDGITFAVSGHKCSVKIGNLKLTRESLIELIKAGGGTILHRAPSPRTCEDTVNYPYHSNVTKTSRCCHYIIYEENNPPMLTYQMAEIKHRSSKWLLDCITSFTILD